MSQTDAAAQAVEWARRKGGRKGTGEAQDFPCTDYGNARRLIHHFGGILRYCAALGGWLVSDGKRWCPDDTGEIWRCTKDAMIAIADEGKEATDSKRQAELFKWAAASQSRAKINAAEELARTELEVVARLEEFDADELLFNVANGTLVLDRIVRHLPHDPGDLITKISPVMFRPEARAPRWMAFLERVLPDPSVREYVQRALAYSLIGGVRENALFIPLGIGANGKSVLLETYQHLTGDYGRVADSGLLLLHRNEQHPTSIADLQGARFVSTTEPDPGKPLAESVVKQLTGGDRVKARRMREDFFEFDPSWTIWMSANHRPQVRGNDDGIWRRIKLIPFPVRIPPNEQDPSLTEKLKAESSGILNWVLEGLAAYWERGLEEPPAVLNATAEYRTESDPLALFLEECTRSGSNYSVPAGRLWDAWRAWCDGSGHRAGTQTGFGRLLADAGWEKRRTNSERLYMGLRLLDSPVESRLEAVP